MYRPSPFLKAVNQPQKSNTTTACPLQYIIFLPKVHLDISGQSRVIERGLSYAELLTKYGLTRFTFYRLSKIKALAAYSIL